MNSVEQLVGAFMVAICLAFAPRVSREPFERIKNAVLLTGTAAISVIADFSRVPSSMLVRVLIGVGVLWVVWMVALSCLREDPMANLVGRRFSYDGAIQHLCYLALFIVGTTIERPFGFVSYLGWTAIILSVYALWQVLTEIDVDDWQSTKYDDYRRPHATLGQPNILAAVLVMLLPWAIAHSVVGTLLCFVAILLTLSRAAWGATLAVTLWFAMMGDGGGLILFGLFLLLGFYIWIGPMLFNVVPELHDAFTQRVGELFSPQGDRVMLLRVCRRIIAKHPSGVGPENFPLVVLDEGGDELSLQIYLRAHSDPVHVLVTMGWFGGALMGLVVTLLTSHFFSLEYDSTNLMLTGSLVGFAVCVLPAFHNVTMMALAALFLGMVVVR